MFYFDSNTTVPLQCAALVFFVLVLTIENMAIFGGDNVF